MKTKKLIATIVSVLLIVTVLSSISVPVFAATSGNSQGRIDVKISQELLNKKGKQNATVTVDFKKEPLTIGTKWHITMYDQNWRWVKEFDVSGNSKKTFKLGDDHTMYHICINQTHRPMVTACKNWKVTKYSKCSVS